VDKVALIEGLIGRVQPISRRGFLKRAAAITVAIPAGGALLAACGGDDDGGTTPTVRATATQAVIPTTNTGVGQASPTTAASPDAGGATPTTGASPQATAAAPQATATTAQTGAGEPKRGGRLVVQGHQEIASLHPDDSGPTVHWVIVANMHDGMLEVDKDFNLVPMLARGFEVSSDGLEMTFELEEGVLFHDGEEFTAEDVVYTFDWYRNPENAAVNANSYAGIESVEAVDDYTAIIRLKSVDASFLVLGATTFILPEHYHSEVGKEGYASAPIGTGPFKLKEWRAAEQTTLVANDDYFRGRPYLDEYQEQIVPEPSVRAIALENGESHHAVWPLTPDDNLRFLEDDRFLVLRAPSAAINHFPLNNEVPALSEREVRQAMMFAIDRDRLINDLEKGLAVLATSNLSPALVFYYEPDVAQYPYDPDRAVEILDGAGWAVGADGIREKNGVRLSFTCTVIAGDQRRKPEAEVVQQDLLKVGIEMKIVEDQVATILAQLPQPGTTMEASLFNWTYGGGSGEPDARTTLRSDAARNFSHYKNPRVDELLDAGVATTDPEERREAYSEIQKIVAEDVPFLFIMFWEWLEIWSKKVKGVPESSPNTNGPYRLIHTYWLDESA
jgi:peptide/nickel transport system substrate-binding protein